VDVKRDSADWPLVGFILMIDEFRSDNGATRFAPGSHRWPRAPESGGEVPACGPAGAMLIFNGSVAHGHGANSSDEPRRSLQGAFIPRDGRAATDFTGRMSSETSARLSGLARHLLDA
jgi:ectoine hydroxylase-related dioxygenase (phytanoyl-CoA dioxygenase family)